MFMNDELDYAEMLEIPVSTVNVVKKKSVFKRKTNEREDLKEKVLDSVNEKMEEEPLSPEYDYLKTENLSDIPQPAAEGKVRDKASIVLFVEAVLLCLIAGAIFLTNIFVPQSVINTFLTNLTAVEEQEAAYNEFTLTSVVSELSDAEVTVTSDGVICFTDKTLVYPVCGGEIASVTQSNGLYTVKIAHTSTFSSVITGLDTVYASEGEEVAANIPFAYSSGENQVRVSMYDGETLLNCYTMSGAVPVWNS
jgi:hypothetical protein